ncbi:MAG: nucleoside 2-deoxyribosyltransferase [Nitrosomonas sp.]|nr:nucleoside 2-deoxyribosyltransferase [Nitrosomonas sp.]
MNDIKLDSYLTGVKCEFERDALKQTNIYWDDPICGTYSITDDASRELDSTIENKRKITNVLAQSKCRGIYVPIRITLNNHGKDGDWNLETIQGLLSQYPISPIEMLDEALVNISYLIKHPSESISINKNRFFWYLYSFNYESSFYMLQQLEGLGCIKFLSKGLREAIITIEAGGWKRLSELRNSFGKDRKQAFIAMWFDRTMDSFYLEGIKPAIEHDGTKCLRIDLQEHNNKICDEIIAEIRRSSYLVADFTGNRGGVYYEAGFAYGLGIPVIWTIHKDHLNDVHFDTRQYNHIVYETEKELKERLLSRIKATII